MMVRQTTTEADIDTDQLFKDWSSTSCAIRRPTLEEGRKTIESLCHEVIRLRKEVEYQKRRQDLKEQQFKTMFVELQNVVNKYGNNI